MKSFQKLSKNGRALVTFFVGMALMVSISTVMAAPPGNPPGGSPTANFSALNVGTADQWPAGWYGPDDVGVGDDLMVDDRIHSFGDIQSLTGAIYAGATTDPGVLTTYGPLSAGDIFATDDVFIDDDLVVGGDTNIAGTLQVDATSTFNNTASFTNNVTFSNPVTLSADATFNDITITGTCTGPGCGGGSVGNPLLLDGPSGPPTYNSSQYGTGDIVAGDDLIATDRIYSGNHIVAAGSIRTDIGTGWIGTGTTGSWDFSDFPSITPNTPGNILSEGHVMASNNVYANDDLYTGNNLFVDGGAQMGAYMEAGGPVYSVNQDVYAMAGDVYATAGNVYSDNGKIYTGDPSNWGFADVAGSPTSVSALPVGAILATGNAYVDGTLYTQTRANFANGFISYGGGVYSNGSVGVQGSDDNIYTGTLGFSGNLFYKDSMDGGDLAATDDLFVDMNGTIGSTLRIGTPTGTANSLGGGDLGAAGDLKSEDRVLADSYIESLGSYVRADQYVRADTYMRAGDISGLPSASTGDILAGDDIYAIGNIGYSYYSYDESQFDTSSPYISTITRSESVYCDAGDERTACGGFAKDSDSDKYYGSWPKTHTDGREGCSAEGRGYGTNRIRVYAYCFSPDGS
jgi:hypothetical protein